MQDLNELPWYPITDRQRTGEYYLLKSNSRMNSGQEYYIYAGCWHSDMARWSSGSHRGGDQYKQPTHYLYISNIKNYYEALLRNLDELRIMYDFKRV